MPISSPPLGARTLRLAAVVLGLAVCTASGAQPPAPAKAPAATNALPAAPEPPKSVFRIPVSVQDGRDPFFPQSTRRKPLTVVTSTTPAAIVELELKGISGTPDHRLAIINNRTFGPGEEGTIATNVGRVRILCKEINADSVRVLLNGELRTLTLHPR